MQILYHLDESVDHAIALGLRRRGLDVITATEARLIGAPDKSHVEFAKTQGRVLFTHDTDFLRLHQSGEPHAGIVYCHPRRRSLGQMVHALVALWRVNTTEEMRGRLVFL